MAVQQAPANSSGRRRAIANHRDHPFFGAGAIRYQIFDQAEDDETRTAQTIGLMSYFARRDAKSDLVRSAAYDAVRDVPGNDASRYAAAIWRWIKSHVRFIDDQKLSAPLAGVDDDAEILVRPVDLLSMPQPAGDCDDFSMLAAAMLRALAVPSSFRTIEADTDNPGTYSHVFVIAHTPTGDLPLDASHGPYPGWQAEPTGKTRTWSTDNMPSHLQGIEFADTGGTFTDILKSGAATGFDILKARFGQPPAGTFIQKGPGGESTFFRQQTGPASALSFPTSFSGPGSSNMTTILIIIAVIAAVAFLTRK